MPVRKAKKKCCQDRPRCKSCPLVLKRLADAGYVERTGKRKYVVEGKVPTKAMKAARAA